MKLEVKSPDHIVPQYSLTGDLISFMRCPMQYRYYNGSALPPSRPVQMWYGEFIHGTLETAYRLWKEAPAPFPWPYRKIVEGDRVEAHPEPLERHDLRRFGWDVENVLIQQNKRARSTDARISAYSRAQEAISLLGPHLFPLISATEQKLIRTRDIPEASGPSRRRANQYILTGIVDVLTNIELSTADDRNVFKQAIQEACADLVGSYEVIVDYKGSHRPRPGEAHWDEGGWQVQTYGWLRQSQPNAKPVAAGVLVYINELDPGNEEARRLQIDLRSGNRDLILPDPGTDDHQQISNWHEGAKLTLSETFRYRRAIRVVPITSQSTLQATGKFDQTVATIEGSVAAEASCGSISSTWKPACDDWQTCVACDFFPFCPKPALKKGVSRAQGQKEPDEP